MLISVSKRFVFVANTKAASTSFEHMLFPYCEIQRAGTPGRKHIPLASILHQEYRFLFENPRYPADTFFKFGIVRDPIQWIGSWFRYRQGNKVAEPLPKEMSFQEFCERKDWNFFNNGRRYLQSNLFCSESGEILADYLIPYENIETHAKIICGALDIEYTIPRINESLIGPEHLSISDRLYEHLRDYYKKDYELISQIPELNEAGLQLLHRTAAELTD